jgi:hypothetical protein
LAVAGIGDVKNGTIAVSGPETEEKVTLNRLMKSSCHKPDNAVHHAGLLLVTLLLVPGLLPAAVFPTTGTIPGRVFPTTGTIPQKVKMTRTSPTLALGAVPTSITAVNPPPPAFMTMEQLDAKAKPSGLAKDTSNVLVLLYNGNRRAYIEPCSCKAHKLGGIDREARVTSRIQEWGLPMLKVDAGGFGKTAWNIRDYLMARYMMGAMKMMNYDAINVGLVDLELGPDFFADVKKQWDTPFVSANIVDATSTPLFMPYKVVPAKLKTGETVRVGIIGVTRPGAVVERKWAVGGAATIAGSGTRITDPAEALAKYLPELRAKSDYVVLLTWQTREKAQEFVAGLGPNSGIDVAVSSEMTVGKPIGYYRNNVETTGTTSLLGTWMEGRYLGNLMVSFTGVKPTRTANQVIEIQQEIPPVPEVTELVDKYRADLRNPRVLQP